MALEQTEADLLARIASTDWGAVTAETGLDAETIIQQWAPNLDKEEIKVFTRSPDTTGE